MFFSYFCFNVFFVLQKPKYYVLENGLQIVVLENNRVPAIAHSIWYKVGSADEPNGKSGIASPDSVWRIIAPRINCI